MNSGDIWRYRDSGKPPNCPHYWPLPDDALIAALEKRYARFSTLHPDVVSGGQHT